jgi:hypothetical protein
VAELVDATDLDDFECLGRNAESRTAQIRGKLLAKAGANPEPSRSNSEGVETRRAAPTANGYGEGIVQTPNAAQAAAAKAVAGKKIRRLLSGIPVRFRSRAPF